MHYTLLSLGLLLALWSCEDSSTQDNTTTAVPIQDIQWHLISMKGETEGLPQANVNFTLDSKTQEVQGFTGCNQFSGGYTKTEDNLQFGELISSTRACLEMVDERQFTNIFMQTAQYQLQEDVLQLQAEDGEVLAVFAKSKPEQPTTTTLFRHWELVSMVDEATSTVTNSTNVASLHLASTTEKMTAYTGCNDIFSTYQHSAPNNLSFPNLTYTEKACPKLMDFENSFIEALRKTTQYNIEGNQLTLLAGEQALATFQPVEK